MYQVEALSSERSEGILETTQVSSSLGEAVGSVCVGLDSIRLNFFDPKLVSYTVAELKKTLQK